MYYFFIDENPDKAQRHAFGVINSTHKAQGMELSGIRPYFSFSLQKEKCQKKS